MKKKSIVYSDLSKKQLENLNINKIYLRDLNLLSKIENFE